MNIRAALKGQYHASLATLKQAIERCPEDLWAEGGNCAPFWRAVNHALFFTEFYLQASPDVFKPIREPARELIDLSNPTPDATPYTQAEMLDYWQACDQLVDKAIDALDLDSEQSGFHWYDIPRLDFQINNIRHIQNHAAALAARLRHARGIEIDWQQGRRA